MWTLSEQSDPLPEFSNILRYILFFLLNKYIHEQGTARKERFLNVTKTVEHCESNETHLNT